MATDPDAARFLGSRAIDYRGVRVVLGRTDRDYAIWEGQGGSPIHTFELSDAGWAGAWRTYRELEGPGADPFRTAAWERGRPIPLQPMRVGQILDGAFRIYRLHFRVVIAIVALVLVPYQGLSLVLQLATIEPVVLSPGPGLTPVQVYQAPTWVGITTSLLYFVVVTPLLTAAVVRAAADAYLGVEVSVSRAYRAALPRTHSILWVTILTALALLVISSPVIILALLSAASGEDALADLAVVIGVVAVIPAIMVIIRLLFGPAVVMVDDQRGWAALRRSWRLVRGLSWKVFGAMILTILLLFAFLLVLQLVFFGIFFATVGTITLAFYVWVAVVSVVISVLTTPFAELVVVLLYFDARIRKEGFDLEVMARELGRQPSTGA
jgi:hypothetical protein